MTSMALDPGLPLKPSHPMAGMAPRLPRPAAMLLCVAALITAALITPGAAGFNGLARAMGLDAWVPLAHALSLLLSATALLALLFRQRLVGLLFGAAAAIAAIAGVVEAASVDTSALVGSAAAHTGKTASLLLFVAAVSTAMVAWPRPGAARWAGIELTTGFLLAAGGVGLVSGPDAGGDAGAVSLVAGLPSPVAIGLIFLGLGLQGLILDPSGQRQRRLRPMMFATLTVALGIWVAVAMSYAQPHSDAHGLVLAAVLLAGPIGAWLIAGRMAQDPTDSGAADAEVSWTPPVAVLASDSAPGAVDAVSRMSTDGVAMVNADGRLTVFNEALTAMYGFEQAPYMGHASAQALTLYGPDRQAIAWAQSPLGRALAGETVKDADIRFHPVGKPMVEALVSARPFTDSEGHAAGAVMLVRDVTAKRSKERAYDAQVALVQRSAEELKRVSFVSAHHLQEPVRGITSYAQLLKRRLAGDEEAAEYLGFLTQESQRIKSLVTDLLRYLELDSAELQREVLDVALMLERARDRVAPEYPDKELALLHDELPQVHADPVLLEALLTAIVDNTAKFGAKGMPALTVSGRHRDDLVELVFTDNGPGIGAEHADKVFELFAQLQNIGDTPGNGAGLSMVRKIARLHGGDAVFDTRAMGGIRLVVTLPRPAQTEA